MQATTSFMFTLILCFGVIQSVSVLKNKETKTNLQTSLKYYYGLATNWNDRGEGNFWYLDRHFLNCNYRTGHTPYRGMNFHYSQGTYTRRFLTGFHLDRSGDRIRYQFNCSHFGFSGNTNAHQTSNMSPTYDVYFDRNPWFPRNSAHHLNSRVQCPNGQALVAFGLIRIPKEKEYKDIDGAWFINEVAKRTDLGYNLSILSKRLFKLFGVEEKVGDPLRYVYDCAPLPRASNCVQHETQWTHIHNGYTEYLDRQHINVGPNQAIQGFQMHSSTSKFGTGNIRYTYTVCTLN